MDEPRPISLAVRAALYGVAITATPALLATGVGIAHGRVAEPIVRCQRGQEVAVCSGHPVTDEPEVHRREIVLPPEPESTVITPLTGRIVMEGLPPHLAQTGLADPGDALGTPLPLIAG
jgi:hypothetical protein